MMGCCKSPTPTLKLLLVVCLAFPLCSCRGLDVTEGHFIKVAGHRMDAPDQEIRVYTFAKADRRVIKCGVHCSSSPSCQTFSVSTQSNTCVLLSKAVYDMSVSWVADPAWNTWMLVPESVNHNNWTLVFRGTAGTESPMFDIYLGSRNDQHYQPGCLTLGNHLPCHSHFRSPILDEWNNIDQVRVSLYRDGTEEQYIVFDGAGSTTTSWFSKDKIIESSWTSLGTINFEHFDAYGYSTPSKDVIRRFYINVRHDSCSHDIGYLAILEMPFHGCWINGSTLTPYPWILYSRTDNYVTWYDGDYGFADVFAVLVKFSQ